MRFGMLYELQLPKPWAEDSEQRLVHEAIDQCVLGDKLGIDYAWSVEHHFLEEYSHCSASDVFLSAIAAKTNDIKMVGVEVFCQMTIRVMVYILIIN